MKLNDIIVESKPVTEAPMGMLSRAGHGVMSKFGSGKSTGKLDAGATANALRKEFDVYLGRSGSEPDAQTVISFLQQKGWPTKGAEQVLQGTNTKGPGTDQGGQQQPAADQGGQQATQQQANPKQTANPQPQGRIDPTMDPINPAQDAAPPAAADTGAAKPKGGLPGMDVKAPSNPDQKLDPKTVAAKKAELLARRGKQNSQGTTKSGFGNYVKKASGQRITGANPDGSPKVVKINAGMYEAAGALPSSVIDKAFLRAVQDGNKLGGGQNQQQPAQGAGGSQGQQGGSSQGQQQGGGDQGAEQPGAFDTFKQNAGIGKTKPGQSDPNAERKGSLNANQLATLLPNVDPAQLKRASNMVLQGGKLNQQMLGVLGQAFGEVLKADPQVTMKIMTILKKVEA